MNYWFPSAEYFDVCPKWSIPNCEGAEDSSIDFVVEHYGHPILLVEIQAPSDFQFVLGRTLAISQVIAHLDEIGPTNQHADRLYAISAMGKRWRACYANRGGSGEEGQPVEGIAVKTSLQSSSQECWNSDITSNESWVALQGIVETIKGYVTLQLTQECEYFLIFTCYMASHMANQ